MCIRFIKGDIYSAVVHEKKLLCISLKCFVNVGANNAFGIMQSLQVELPPLRWNRTNENSPKILRDEITYPKIIDGFNCWSKPKIFSTSKLRFLVEPENRGISTYHIIPFQHRLKKYIAGWDDWFLFLIF